jgi:hypothetical protein
MKRNNIIFILFCVISIIVIYLIIFTGLRTWYLYTTPDINKEINMGDERLLPFEAWKSLKKNGIALLPDFLTNSQINVLHGYIEKEETDKIKSFLLNATKAIPKIKSVLGEDYIFQDYIFFIKRSQFHTCHRDYNGDFFNESQKYPSYTIIIYLEDMEKCLDVIPGSHLNKSDYDWNMTDYTQTVLCKKGDAILFDANLVHGGSLNQKENNPRIQMKVSHKEDDTVLDFYNQYYKILNIENTTPFFMKQIQKNISCQFPAISTYLKEFDGNYRNSKTNSWFSSFFTPLDTIPNS